MQMKNKENNCSRILFKKKIRKKEKQIKRVINFKNKTQIF
jgi:hypothetical protein